MSGFTAIVEDDIENEILDPQIPIELERLNNLSTEINELEAKTDEANETFRSILSQSASQLKLLSQDIGPKSIEKARPYYDALKRSLELQRQTQLAAIEFQRANGIHKAAKETIKLAESKFEEILESADNNTRFDAAWQEMLNHATQKVNESEALKLESEKRHKLTAAEYTTWDRLLSHMEHTMSRSLIARARPYFEIKEKYNQALEDKKQEILKLQGDVLGRKEAYRQSLKTLEHISERIHQQRMASMAKGYPHPMGYNRRESGTVIYNSGFLQNPVHSLDSLANAPFPAPQASYSSNIIAGASARYPCLQAGTETGPDLEMKLPGPVYVNPLGAIADQPQTSRGSSRQQSVASESPLHSVVSGNRTTSSSFSTNDEEYEYNRKRHSLDELDRQIELASKAHSLTDPNLYCYKDRRRSSKSLSGEDELSVLPDVIVNIRTERTVNHENDNAEEPTTTTTTTNDKQLDDLKDVPADLTLKLPTNVPSAEDEVKMRPPKVTEKYGPESSKQNVIILKHGVTLNESDMNRLIENIENLSVNFASNSSTLTNANATNPSISNAHSQAQLENPKSLVQQPNAERQNQKLSELIMSPSNLNLEYPRTTNYDDSD